MENVKNVLITGGSGMIGSRLTAILKQKGYSVSHLSRTRKAGETRTFYWNPQGQEIDREAFRDTDVIIHLAGRGIADKRWDADYKKEILLSRTQSTRLLREALAKEKHHVHTVVSASGISYYGLHDHGTPIVESDPPANDFMAEVTQAWEKEVDALSKTVTRIVKIRTGVVLSKTGGALKKLAKPVYFFVGAPLGSGDQYINWIHIDDLCRMYIKAMEDPSMVGAYNAVAPHPVTNKALTKEIAKTLNRPLWLPPVPSFVVKVIAGQVADVVLGGGMISCRKIEDAGFRFQFPTVKAALQDLLLSKD
ncbi:MAG TPA: TIGR01777 family oxidoreductase [Chryseosolibacter sp.]|nr:TIGR01777 family oxidoreductase [Chryseosolibacter sp.]